METMMHTLDRLDRHALLWNRIPLCRPESPETFERGAYLGNGTLGALVYGVDEPCDFPHHALQVDVGRMDVADAGGTRVDGSEWWDKWDRRHKTTRLHTGGFRLLTSGLAEAGAMRLDLALAECQAEFSTGHGDRAGTIAARVFAAATADVMIIDIAHGGCEKRPRFVRRPMPFPGWPAATVRDRDGIRIESQPLLDGQEYAVAWCEIVERGRVLLVASLGVSPRIKRHSRGVDDGRAAGEEAFAAVQAARAQGVDGLLTAHRAWWADFHGRSRIAIPDARLEGFYAINAYTLGSTTRAGAPFPDATGPWSYAMSGPGDHAHCPGYPHIWINLNAQMHFLLHLGSNHAAECGEVLMRTLAMLSDRLVGDDPAPDLIAVAGGGCGYDFYEGDMCDESNMRARGKVGTNLVWLLHNAWLTSRYATQYSDRWRRLLPLLAAATNEMLARVRPGEDGRLHVSDSFSPEYPPTEAMPFINAQGCTDACYELAILRWSLTRLSADLPNDGRAPRWREVGEKLADYPEDESGLRIARDVPYTVAHRHYSHMMMAWPFREWDGRDPARRELVKRTMQTWLTRPPDHKGQTEFTWAAAAALAAHCGDGEQAWKYLNTYLDAPSKGVKSQCFSNTLAREWGLILETPLGAANVVQEMLLQSHGGMLRIFPAVPAEWQEAEFLGLAGEGGFTVSARREQGRTAWVEVTSHAGEAVSLAHGIDAPLEIRTTGGMQVQDDGGQLRLQGPIGGVITICRAGAIPQTRPVAERFHPHWRWGGART